MVMYVFVAKTKRMQRIMQWIAQRSKSFKHHSQWVACVRLVHLVARKRDKSFTGAVRCADAANYLPLRE